LSPTFSKQGEETSKFSKRKYLISVWEEILNFFHDSILRFCGEAIFLTKGTEFGEALILSGPKPFKSSHLDK
jgi:hypothetical protein